MYYISCKNLGISYKFAMSKINKDFEKDLQELENKVKDYSQKADQKLNEMQYGDWTSVAELEDFEISFRSGSLLSGSTAQVTFFYKLPKGKKDHERKKLVIFGDADAVQDRSMMVIKRKKNYQAGNDMQNKFKHAWTKAVEQGFAGYARQPNPFNLRQPSMLLDRSINRTGLDKKTFAEKSGKKSASLYHHTRGTRDISREAAIEYAELLNIDPVDLLFNKITIPIWAKVNTLKYVETDDSHQPCKLYSYYTKNPKMVIVPRDIYRSNLKAVQIEADGSMYDGQVAFYYYSHSVKFEAANKLCVVGIKEKGFMDMEETNYYFGLVEQIRGKTNLLNPDPYCDEEDKIIRKNIDPTFTAPVIAMVNPDQIRDRTASQSHIPAHYLRSEEKLKQEIAYLQADLLRQKEKSKRYSDIEKEVQRTMNRLMQQQQQLDKMLREKENEDLFYQPGFLKGKKRA